MAPGRHSKEIFLDNGECASRELIKLIGKLRWIRKGEAKDAERKLRATSRDMEAAWRAWIGTISSPSRIVDPGAQGPDAVITSADTLQQALAPVDQLLNANPLHDVVPVDWAAIAASLRILWVRALRDPQKAAASMIGLQIELWSSASKIWVETAERWSATLAGGGAEGGELPREKDRRFSDPQWQTNPFFRILRESYSLASEWLLNQDEGKDLSPEERQRLNFHLRQFIDATSPTLMLASNPTALKKAFETGGLSIAEGLNNLARDIKEGRLSMVDANAFAPGRNLALTPGKVVYRNRLIELIQYEPQTESVYERPILFIPPWINKYLHSRLAAEEQPDRASCPARLRGLRDFLEESGRLDGWDHHRGLHGTWAARRQRCSPRDHGRQVDQRNGVLHRRHSSRNDAGLPRC